MLNAVEYFYICEKLSKVSQSCSLELQIFLSYYWDVTACNIG